jgi:metallo-beta-lactamase family protein
MMEGGRIQEHIIANIGNVHCRILIAGYCTPGTLGHQLLERKTTVQIRRNSYPVLAEIASTDIFSAHPDSDGLMNYALNVREKGKLKKVFLTHGEPSSLAVFQNSLQEKDFVVKVPNRGETVLV